MGKEVKKNKQTEAVETANKYLWRKGISQRKSRASEDFLLGTKDTPSLTEMSTCEIYQESPQNENRDCSNRGVNESAPSSVGEHQEALSEAAALLLCACSSGQDPALLCNRKDARGETGTPLLRPGKHVLALLSLIYEMQLSHLPSKLQLTCKRVLQN